MNRIKLTVLLIAILNTPALCQKPDSMVVQLDSLAVQPDSMAVQPDSLAVQTDSFAVQPDSLAVQTDSLTLQPDSFAVQPDSMVVQLDSLAVQPDSMAVRKDSQAIQPFSDTIPFPKKRERYTTLVPSDTVYAGDGTDSADILQDPLRAQADSIRIAESDLSHSPSKAIMYALVLPGLGQAYNRKFYKMPIVWAALGGAGYAISYNSKNYKQASLDYALNQDETYERYLRGWRRYVELSYIALMAVYALQVLDAYVDAQLFNWDVNDNLSMSVSPSLQPLMVPTSTTGYTYGLTCSINLKRLRGR